MVHRATVVAIMKASDTTAAATKTNLEKRLDCSVAQLFRQPIERSLSTAGNTQTGSESLYHQIISKVEVFLRI